MGEFINIHGWHFMGLVNTSGIKQENVTGRGLAHICHTTLSILKIE